MNLNKEWENKILSKGVDFVYFTDISDLGLPCSKAILFGKALSKEYIRCVKDEIPVKHKEVLNIEQKMDRLSLMFAKELGEEQYIKLRIPHKTVALRAGLGFIGKNNLLVSAMYGCAFMLGKVLTNMPFDTVRHDPLPPLCKDCTICQSSCPSGALKGHTWDISTVREDMLTRKLCSLCLKCMVNCPYTINYINS